MMKKQVRGRTSRYVCVCAVTALMALLFCACAGEAKTPRSRTVATIPGAADTALPKRIELMADAQSPEYILTAAENFCRVANSISSGIFTVSLAKSSDSLSEFKRGKADIILLEGKSAEALHPFFAIANEPFRYSSYEDFSVTCNSGQVRLRLSEYSNANVFAAYYTGSNAFAGYASLDDTLGIDRDAKTETVEHKVKITTAPGLGTWLRLCFPDVTVIELQTPVERIKAIKGNALVEIPSEPAMAAELTDVWTDSEQSAVVTVSFHSIEPMWLILTPSLYEMLPPLGKAAIDEAAAFMAGDIDMVSLEREKLFIAELEEASVEISGGFTSSRARMLRSQASRIESVSREEKELREIFSLLQRG